MSRARGVATLGLGAALLAAGLSCRDGTGPEPGQLRLLVSVPVANDGLDGAILFTITGPAAPSAITPTAGFRAFTTTPSLTTTVALTGTLSNAATILLVDVPDVNAVYNATIRQVAAAADYQLRSLQGYSLTLSK